MALRRAARASTTTVRRARTRSRVRLVLSAHTCACSENPRFPRPCAEEQTPNHPGGGPAYPVDGECFEQCDCGTVNPCGEYIFDHRGAPVNGQSFRDW